MQSHDVLCTCTDLLFPTASVHRVVRCKSWYMIQNVLESFLQITISSPDLMWPSVVIIKILFSVKCLRFQMLWSSSCVSLTGWIDWHEPWAFFSPLRAEICEKLLFGVTVMIPRPDQVSTCPSCFTYQDWILVAVKNLHCKFARAVFLESVRMILSDFPASSFKFSRLSVTVVVLSVLASSRLGRTELWFHSTAVPRSVSGRQSLSEKTDTFRDKTKARGGGGGRGWGGAGDLRSLLYLEVHEAVQGWFMGFHSCRMPGGLPGKVVCLNVCKEHLDLRGWEVFSEDQLVFSGRPAVFFFFIFVFFFACEICSTEFFD